MTVEEPAPIVEEDDSEGAQEGEPGDAAVEVPEASGE
jgi:hypothetical protein